MKKFLFSLIAVGLATASFAQTPVSYKKRPSLGFGLFLNDMYTADKISRTSLSRVMQSGGFTPISQMSMIHLLWLLVCLRLTMVVFVGLGSPLS